MINLACTIMSFFKEVETSVCVLTYMALCYTTFKLPRNLKNLTHCRQVFMFYYISIVYICTFSVKMHCNKMISQFGFTKA